MANTKSKFAIKTPYNADEFPKHREHNFGPSMTIPDQTMSLKELLDRYQRGIPVHGDAHPIYHGDDEAEELPDLKKLDLSEIAELRDRIAQDIKDKQEELLRQQGEENRKIAEQKQRELFKKWKDEEDAAATPTNQRAGKKENKD